MSLPPACACPLPTPSMEACPALHLPHPFKSTRLAPHFSDDQLLGLHFLMTNGSGALFPTMVMRLEHWLTKKILWFVAFISSYGLPWPISSRCDVTECHAGKRGTAALCYVVFLPYTCNRFTQSRDHRY